MAKFNYRELTKAVATSAAGTKRVNTVMQKRFEEAKVHLIQEFESHPVTREIEAGPGARNDSGTLQDEGDLFSFIGFEQGSSPTEPVKNVLRNETVLSQSKVGVPAGGKIQYKFSLRLPTESIKNVSPLPWEKGLSWVEGIERGISGFGNYIQGRFRSPEPSRSGGGKQVEEKVRTATFKKRKYLSEIVAKFIARF